VEACFEEAVSIREQLLKAGEPGRRETLLRDAVFTRLGFAAAYAGKSLQLDAEGGRKLMLDAKRVLTEAPVKEQLVELGYKKQADALFLFLAAGDDNALGFHQEAVKKLENAHRLIEDAGKEWTVLTQPVSYELGRTLIKLQQYPKAATYYQEVVDIARTHQFLQMPEQEEKLTEFANLLRRLNRAPEAEKLWIDYLAALKFRFTERHDFYREAYQAYQKFYPVDATK
jgi:hypothetical protein